MTTDRSNRQDTRLTAAGVTPGGLVPAPVQALVDDAQGFLTGTDGRGPGDRSALIEVHHQTVTVRATTRTGARSWPATAPPVERTQAGRAGGPVLWFLALGLCVIAATIGVVVPDCEPIGIIGCIAALVVGGAGLARQVQP